MPKKTSHPDFVLLGISAVLLGFGILVLSSVSGPFSQEKFGNTYYYLLHQLAFGLLPGLILGFIAYKINLSVLKKWALALMGLNLVFMVMVFLPVVGITAGGAARWINFGFASFQPSELLKLSFVIYLASWLSARTEKGMKIFSQTFVAFLVIIGVISLLLIFQPDISTLCIIVLAAVLMYFSINTPVWHSALLLLAGAGALLGLIKFAPYRLSRIAVFLNPDKDPMGIGYQVKQILIAVGSGGITGVGLGMSAQKMSFLPQSISDAIFAVFAKETGFLGGVALVILFLMFAVRGAKVAQRNRDSFSRILGLGICLWITIQAFVNIGSISGVLPLMGVPLPFFSYGGTALAMEIAGLGILLNISKNSS